jgi:hypothetical protein
MQTNEVSMRSFACTMVVLLSLGAGCPASGTPVVPGPDPVAPAALKDIRGAPAPKPSRFTPPDKIAPDRVVWAYADGQRRKMDIDEARALGLTVVDLSDDWVPYIFWSQTPGKEDYAANRYLDHYVDLANDRIDVDGVPLSATDRNYLEVYGIPPSLGVLRKRFLEDEKKTCYRDLDLDLFKEYHGPIRIGDPAGSKRLQRRFYSWRGRYKKALREARVRTLEALLAKDKYRKLAERYRKVRWQYLAIQEFQKRLECEDLYDDRKPRIKPGIVNWAVRRALRRFERKHNIFGWGLVFQNTSEALGRTPRQNNYQSLRRVLTERVVSAAGIIEDGTRTSYKDAAGVKHGVRNLVREFSDAIIKQMGLTDEDEALAFIKRHKDFKHFWVAVKLPEVPEYYSDQMDLEVIIDRGDVWYDFPNKFNDRGRLIPRPRGRFPQLTLYVKYNEARIPLVRWRTTIGSWQPEMRHDQEYYKYKISDVGPRIWRHIVAGPVWVPPRNTPSRDMVKMRTVRGRNERIVAHNSFGPGYASAYGLVAAFHVTEGGRDNQVRTHGTVNYMSISSSNGFSHGCHRLRNYAAVRLFSFVLRHRAFERKGQTRLAYSQRFEHKGEEFEIDLRTRGYYYELTPPVPVNVLEGRIRGEAQKPIERYIKKPTVVYQEDLPTLKRKTPAGAPRVKKKRKGLLSQPQNL